jgi:hypothetical protein
MLPELLCGGPVVYARRPAARQRIRGKRGVAEYAATVGVSVVEGMELKRSRPSGALWPLKSGFCVWQEETNGASRPSLIGEVVKDLEKKPASLGSILHPSLRRRKSAPPAEDESTSWKDGLKKIRPVHARATPQPLFAWPVCCRDCPAFPPAFSNSAHRSRMALLG